MPIEHRDFLIDLVDEQGQPVSQKPRKAVDKTIDLYHAIYVLVVTPDKQLALSHIPTRDNLPNLYAGKLGITVATIRRHGETKEAAATRALSAEINLDNTNVIHLGDNYTILSDGHRAYITAYYTTSEVPSAYSTADIGGITILTASELDEQLANNKNLIAPTLEYIWKKYSQQIFRPEH